MSMPLLQTKLYLPRRSAVQGRPSYVNRPRLLQALTTARSGKLTLISAPAGFGKSTLLSEWITTYGVSPQAFRIAQSEFSTQVAWLSLDVGDNDPVRFWTYIIAALQTVHAELGISALDLLQAPQPPLAEAILTLLLNDLASLPDMYILVLDDYHVIETPAIHEAVSFLLDHLPDSLHLILSSRADPPLPLARLRARRQLTEIRAADLRFTPEETVAFLNEVMGLQLASADLVALETRTEGWIAGLQLAALSMHGRQDVSEFIRVFTGSHIFIVDYLAEEVIGRQPAAVQAFLLQTSILERMCAPLCNAVTGQTDGQALLETLHQQNLFLIPLDDERKWYRYHHLFVEVLRARLQQAAPTVNGGLAELHHRASLWYEQQGLVSEAIDHALSTGTFEQAVRLIEQLGMMVFSQGAIHYMLNKWLAALPDELVRMRPKLCIIQAWLLLNRMDPEAALHWLAEGEQTLHRNGLPAADPDDARNLRGEIAVTRAIATILSRQFDSAQIHAWAQEALDYLRPDNASYRGLVFGTLGTAAMQQGDVARAEVAFAQAATISRAQGAPAGHEYMALATTLHLTNMQRARGSLGAAIAACQQALEWAAARGAQTSFGAGTLMIQLADLLRERNELATALHYATSGIALSHQGAHALLFMVGSLVVVRIKQALGDLEGIFDLLHQIRLKVANLYQADWLLGLLSAAEAQVHLTQGDLSAALQWAQRTDWAERWPRFFRSTHHFVYAYEYGGITRAQVLIAAAWSDASTGVEASSAKMKGAAAHQERLPDVMSYLERQSQVAAARGLLWLRIKVHILQALAYPLVGDAIQAQTMLEWALELAEPEGYIRIFVDEGEPMRLLLVEFRVWVSRQKPYQEQQRLAVYIDRLLGAFAPGSKATSKSLNPTPAPTQNLIEPLTPRELEILQLIAAGHSNREIARTLVVSLGTVKKHLSNIFGKLAIESRTQAIVRARELQLL